MPDWPLAERAPTVARGNAARQLEPVVEPNRQRGVDQLVHHGATVMRRGRDAQQLLSARDRRIVDRLKVDAVSRHQLVG